MPILFFRFKLFLGGDEEAGGNIRKFVDTSIPFNIETKIPVTMQCTRNEHNLDVD